MRHAMTAPDGQNPRGDKLSQHTAVPRHRAGSPLPNRSPPSVVRAPSGCANSGNCNPESNRKNTHVCVSGRGKFRRAALLVDMRNLSDEQSERSAATVTSLSGAKEYTTNINGEGGSFMHDVHCECSEISARAFGLPCAHCGGHAEFLGITPEDIVHCKDTTVGWQRQYEGLEFPLLSSTSIQNSVLHQPTLQYPPVDAPKCGRPKKTGRIKSSVETQRQRVAVRCSKCNGVGHNKRSVKCPKFGRQ